MGLIVVGVHTQNSILLPMRHSCSERWSDYEFLIRDARLKRLRRWRTKFGSCLRGFLLTKDGYIRFAQQGEEECIWEFERALQQLLAETGYRSDLPEFMLPLREEDKAGAVFPSNG